MRARDRVAGRFQVWTLWLACAAASIVSPSSAGTITLTNDALEIQVDDASGAVVQVHNRIAALDLIRRPELATPFTLTTSAGALGWTSVTTTPDPAFPGAALDLRWTTPRAGVTVLARIELPQGAHDARFAAQVVNDDATLTVDALEYPVLAGIERLLPDGGVDLHASAAAQGYLFRDPWANLALEVRKRLYPDGYDGVSLQTSAYYRDGVGGFALEARDATGLAKNVSFYKDPGSGALRWSLETLSPDRRPGAGLQPGYEARLAALIRGDWQEAADHYRAWALLQPWAARGRVADRADAEVPRWLYETVQAATFGVSINLDQSRWFLALHDYVGGPLFHVSGFWWPGGTAASEWYGGYNDWSDGRVNPANLAAIRGAGDLWAPFVFDNHFSRDATEWDAPAPDPATDPLAPWLPYEMLPDPEAPPWAYMCPATPAWQDFHGWRELELFDQHGFDATYGDIGAGLGRVHCESTGHGHPPGSGPALVEGYHAMLASGRDALHARAGRRIAAGTELVAEPYLGELDFYQARAGASVMSMLEGDAFREAEKAGWAEKIPLFEYVYHDVGPVRLDGNLKAATAFGEIFWWIAARVVAWGGLPELNYELSSLERFPGMSDPFTRYETYKPTFHVIDTSPYAAAPDRGAFLGRLGRARTGFARPWLAYGRMTRPARIVAGPVPLGVSWRLYNTFLRATDTTSGIEQGPEFYQTGSKTVDPIVHAAWDDAGRSLGIFLVDVASTPATVTVEVDPDRHGLPFLNYRLTRIEEGGEQDLGVLSGSRQVSLTLPSRAPVLLRAAPAACTAATCLYRVFRAASGADVAVETTPFAIAAGHAWEEPTPADGMDRYYVVDDGSGRPATIRVEKEDGVVRLVWDDAAP